MATSVHLSNHLHDAPVRRRGRGHRLDRGRLCALRSRRFLPEGCHDLFVVEWPCDTQHRFCGTCARRGLCCASDGHPDVKMWTAGLMAVHGSRLSANSVDYAVPRLRLCPCEARRLRGRQGQWGRPHDRQGKSNHSFLTGGVKWATQLGGVVPELSLGYRYRLGNSRSSFHGWFTPDPENDFESSSAAQKKGTVLAGLSVGGKLGPVDVSIGYEGEFGAALRATVATSSSSCHWAAMRHRARRSLHRPLHHLRWKSDQHHHHLRCPSNVVSADNKSNHESAAAAPS